MPPSMNPKLLAGLTIASQWTSRIDPRWTDTPSRPPQKRSHASASSGSTDARTTFSRISCSFRPRSVEPREVANVVGACELAGRLLVVVPAHLAVVVAQAVPFDRRLHRRGGRFVERAQEDGPV